MTRKFRSVCVVLCIFATSLCVFSCKIDTPSLLAADNSGITDIIELDQDESSILIQSIPSYLSNYQACDYYFDFQQSGAILLINNEVNTLFCFDNNYAEAKIIVLDAEIRAKVLWANIIGDTVIGIVDSNPEQWGNALSVVIWDKNGGVIDVVKDGLLIGEDFSSAELHNEYLLVCGQFRSVILNIGNKESTEFSFNDKSIIDGVLLNDKFYLIEREISTGYPILEEYDLNKPHHPNSWIVQFGEFLRNVNDMQLLRESDDSFFIVVDYSNIFRYTKENHCLKEVMDSSQYGISFTNSVFYNIKNRIICSYMSNCNIAYNVYENRILEISNKTSTKQILTLAIIDDMNSMNTWIQQSVGTFNLHNSNSFIKTIPISESEIRNNPNLLKNNNVDIIAYPSQFIYAFYYAGYTEDISQYLNVAFDETNMIDSIWNAGLINGNRYFITPFVEINILSGSGEIFKSDKIYSFEDFTRFHSSSSYNHIVRHDSLENLNCVFLPLFSDLRSLNVDDWNAYLKFLEKSYSQEYIETSSISHQIANHELLFLNENIGSFASYELMSRYFDDNMILPNCEKLVNAQFVADHFISLFSYSEKKDFAIEYLSFLLSDEFYLSNDSLLYYLIPSTITALEYANKIQLMEFRNCNVDGAYISRTVGDTEQIFIIQPNLLSDAEQATMKQAVENEINRVIDSHSSGRDSLINTAPPDVGIRGVGDYNMCLNKYITLVNSTTSFYYYNYEVEKIINEELSRFESGQIDSADIAKSIYSRLKTYYDEIST